MRLGRIEQLVRLWRIQYSIVFLIVKRMIKEENLRMASFMARITI